MRAPNVSSTGWCSPALRAWRIVMSKVLRALDEFDGRWRAACAELEAKEQRDLQLDLAEERRNFAAALVMLAQRRGPA